MDILTGLHSRLPPVLPHEREFFINRIWSGYTKYNHNGTVLRIYDPSMELKYEAEEIYYKTYNRAINKGILTNDELLEILTRYGIWTEEDNKNWEIYQKDIDHWKMQMFKHAARTQLVSGFRVMLNELKDKHNALKNKRNIFFSASAEGVANFAKWQYIISRSTYRKHRKCDWSMVNIHSVMNYYYSSRISDTMLRYLSHNAPWTTIAISEKYIRGISDKYATQLTDEQMGLLSWTTMYENVRKSHEAPADFIIDDDDMLDGWLLTKQKERRATQAEQTKDSMFSEKVGKHSEVLIMASNKREAMDIYSMNDAKAEAVRQSRMKQLEAKKELRDADFSDVALDLQMRRNRLFNEKLKNSK